MQTTREMQNGSLSGHKMASKPEMKKKNTWWKRRGKERKTNQKHLLNKQKEEARNVSEQQDKGWIHVIRVHDTIHSANNNTAGQHTLTNYPTQRKNEWFVKHQDYPPHSYIINEQYNSRNKRTSREKKTVNGKNRQLAQPGQTLTQGGHKIASLVN